MKVSTRFAIYISNYIYILHETEICYTITDPWVTEIEWVYKYLFTYLTLHLKLLGKNINTYYRHI